MKNLTKGIAAVGALAMLTGVGACGSNTADDKGQVYFLNNKPEVVNQWNELAEMYTKQTGVKVDIQSATSGSYESTLSSELAKNNAPTMFGIGGFDQYAKYKDYLEPLQDTEAYKLLNDQGKQMAHKDCHMPPNGSVSSSTRSSSTSMPKRTTPSSSPSTTSRTTTL